MEIVIWKLKDENQKLETKKFKIKRQKSKDGNQMIESNYGN